MSDYMIRGTAADDKVRIFAVTTRDLVEKARQIHNTSPVATAALGRLLSAASMMGPMMKGDKDLMTLRIKGDGPIGGITVTADSKGNVKGYPENPNVLIHAKPNGKLDVSGAVGKGYLTVIRDLGLKEPYVGQVDLVSGEIAEDLTYYFTTSEQVPSSVGLGVLLDKTNFVKQAGGFIVQLMPDVSDEVISTIEKNLSGVKSVTSMLEEGMSPEDIAEKLLNGLDLRILEKIPVGFNCNCSRERMAKAVISLGEKEIKEMIKDNEPIEINCHFCNSSYEFAVDELKEMLKAAK
ncbi:MAG TPA: Hsp33 family molecular chaperone HslO [Candidatus Alectryocaccobium stercorigallinarum]|nr:Hsp33 family molecular chaperone HslO [Candidatus Alectryocaccobium stercorigallinarum]